MMTTRGGEPTTTMRAVPDPRGAWHRGSAAPKEAQVTRHPYRRVVVGLVCLASAGCTTTSAVTREESPARTLNIPHASGAMDRRYLLVEQYFPRALPPSARRTADIPPLAPPVPAAPPVGAPAPAASPAVPSEAPTPLPAPTPVVPTPRVSAQAPTPPAAPPGPDAPASLAQGPAAPAPTAPKPVGTPQAPAPTASVPQPSSLPESPSQPPAKAAEPARGSGPGEVPASPVGAQTGIPQPPVPHVTLRAHGVPLHAVLRLLARTAGVTLELGRGVTNNDPVSVDLVEEPVDRAARTLVEGLGWDVQLDRDHLRVVAEITRSLRLDFPHLSRSYAASFGGNTLGSAGGVGGVAIAGTTGVTGATGPTGSATTAGGDGGLAGSVSVSYTSDTGDAWKAVETMATKILEDHGTVAIHHDTGIVFLRGRADVVTLATQELQKIDQELSRQVYLEVSVIDVTLNDRTRHGIDWTKVFALGHGAWGTLTLAQPALGLAGSAFTATLARTPRPDAIVVRALEEQGQARILSQPKLLVANGQTALLKVGEVVPFISSVQQTVSGQSGTVVATPTISHVQSGLTIAISPRIQEHGVLLHIAPVLNEVTSFKPFSVGDSHFENPVVATKSLTTIARAASGETVVLGGLIDSKNRRSIEGLPLLSKIPILGVVFRNEDHTLVSRELVIVITPTIHDAVTRPAAPGPSTD